MNTNEKAKRLKARGLSAAAILAMLYLIIPHEGKVNRVYLDPAGIPTACYGQTGKDLYGRKIEMGKGIVYTDEECDLMLALSVPEYEAAILALVKPNGGAIDGRFPSEWYKAALISFTYNLGPGNLARSTLLHLINIGQHERACGQLVRWVRAGGKVFSGLISRRGDEQAWCMGKVPWQAKETYRILKGK